MRIFETKKLGKWEDGIMIIWKKEEMGKWVNEKMVIYRVVGKSENGKMKKIRKENLELLKLKKYQNKKTRWCGNEIWENKKMRVSKEIRTWDNERWGDYIRRGDDKMIKWLD